MNGQQLGQLVAYIALGDNRNADDPLVLQFWAEMVGDLDFEDCRLAVKNHRRTSTDYLQPAHVIAGVKEVRKARRRAELAAERQMKALESGPAISQRNAAQQAYVEANAAKFRAEVGDLIAKAAAKWALPPDVAKERPPLLREPEEVFRAEVEGRA